MKCHPLKLTAVFAGAALAGLSPRQDDPDPGDQQKSTALLRVYPGIDELVGRADGLAAAGKFAEALEIYGEAQKAPNSLVPAEAKSGAPARYVGVLEYCLRRIATWPPEGRAAARRHADPLAGQAFRVAQAARDGQALADVALRYPHSSFADDALALLGNLHLEAGRATEAASAFERLLALPDAALPRPVVQARLGESLARAGRNDLLEALITRTAREAPDEKVIFGDRETSLVATLRALARSAAPTVPSVLAPPSWEMIQGSPTGVRVSDPAELGLRHWSARLDEARFLSDEDQWGGGDSEGRPDSDYRPVIPAVSDGTAYFHTEYSVQAWNLYASATEPLWTHRVPVPAGQLMFEDRLVHATTVSEGRVFANLVTWLGQSEVQSGYIKVKFPFPKRALFALDAYTGKPLWRVGGVSGGDRFEDGLSFSAPPTPAAGFLYAGAIRQRNPTDPFEHYAVCLDPATGRVVWSTFVASGGTEINLFGNSTRESIGSPVSVDADSVYYGTNHGALAALDRTTGRLRWVSRYLQLPVRPTRRIDITRGGLQWLPSAPVVARGLAVFTPTDSRSMFALDAATGEFLWSKPRGGNRMIAGCDGTFLVLSGESGVEWLDLTRGGKLAGRYAPAGLVVTGRPALTTDGVYLPTANGLYRFALQTGSESGFFVGPWRGSRIDGGNVIVAEGAIVVADSKSVEAFLSRTAVDESVEAELKKHPDRADLVYRAALRLLQSGKDARATELLARVIDLVAGSPRPSDARLERAARKRLFAVSKSVGSAALAAGKHAEAQAAFQRAAKAAPDPASSVEAAALLADTAEARGDYAAAIGEYQRLMKESGDEVVGSARVFDLARAAISKVLVAGGRDSYRPFEEEAEIRLGKARSAGTPASLLEVFRSHPNSLAAERAVLEAAELQSKQGKPEEAAGTLRMFLREFPGSGRTLDAQASLVLELEKRSRYASAAVVLRRMAASGATGEVTVEGKRVPVSEFADSRLAREEYKRADATTPDVRLSPPLKKASTYTEREFLLGAAVLRPDGPALKEGSGLTLLNFGGAVKAIDPGTGVQAWRVPTELPVRASFVLEGALILCSETFVSRVNPATGAVEWKHTPGAPMKGFGRAGAMLCYLTADAKRAGASSVVALDPGRGTIAWSQSFAGLALSGLISADDSVAVVTVAPHQILTFDTETGRAGAPVPLFVKGSGLRIVSALRGMLVLHSDEGGLQAFELPAGQKRWWNRLEDWSVTVMTSSSAGLLVAGTERGQPAAMLLDLRSGKRRGVAEGLDGIPASPAAMNNRVAAFAVRREDRNLGVRALDLSDSRLKSAWTADVKRDVLQSVPLLAGGHAAVLHMSATPEGKFEWSADVLDSSGKRVQNISGDSTLERPPSFALASDGLVLLLDNRIEVYR
ncbi:MAG TPA: PQQ-binding-like beta-propeller repeat protein [Planctomycetota bacterium]|nr:PQQ-binding-like beta-propeller repeat protein [Planctomycetota bacterium]